MSEEFFKDWFGRHAGRELGCPERFFTDKPEELKPFVDRCNNQHLPALMSVQPYSARDQVYGLEKLYFDFDCEEDTAKAWRETKIFAEALKRRYNVEPLIKFSGRKGYNVDVFLKNTVIFPTWRIEFVKQVYDTLQRKILKGLKFETLDLQVIGDIKRLERIPYSIHQKTGVPCHPVDLNRNLIAIESVDLNFYREHGLDTEVLKIVCREVKEKERWKEAQARIRAKHPVKLRKSVRPCIGEALKHSLKEKNGHLMRLAIAVEFLNKGYSADQVVDLFRSQADFDEKKTRYYVEDALKKGYKPFRCSKIRKLGFCLGDSCQIYRKRRDLK